MAEGMREGGLAGETAKDAKEGEGEGEEEEEEGVESFGALRGLEGGFGFSFFFFFFSPSNPKGMLISESGSMRSMDFVSSSRGSVIESPLSQKSSGEETNSIVSPRLRENGAVGFLDRSHSENGTEIASEAGDVREEGTGLGLRLRLGLVLGLGFLLFFSLVAFDSA